MAKTRSSIDGILKAVQTIQHFGAHGVSFTGWDRPRVHLKTKHFADFLHSLDNPDVSVTDRHSSKLYPYEIAVTYAGIDFIDVVSAVQLAALGYTPDGKAVSVEPLEGVQ